MRTRRDLSAPLSLTLLVLVAGCDPTPRCVPGTVQACPCAEGLGRQTCASDGTFGPCAECRSTEGGVGDGGAADAAGGDAAVPGRVGDPCTPPEGDDPTTPSPGFCLGNLAVDCGPDGRYAPYLECASGESCVTVGYASGRGGARSSWATCAPTGAEPCDFGIFEDTCTSASRRRVCNAPFPLIQAFVPAAFVTPDHGLAYERDCAADELCDRGTCFVDAAPCTAEESRCDGPLVRICTPGERPVRAECSPLGGFPAVCEPASACGVSDWNCLPEGIETCPRSERLTCLEGGIGYVDCSSLCAGDSSCECARVETLCEPGTRCEPTEPFGASCVPDVDCSAGTFCDGDQVVVCEGTTPSHRFDCDLRGMTCTGSPGAAGCTTGEACTDTGATCDGDAVLACCVDGTVETGVVPVPCVPGQRVRFGCNEPPIPGVTRRCELGFCLAS